MTTNEASPSRRRLSRATSLSLLALLAGESACGGKTFTSSGGPDGGLVRETGGLKGSADVEAPDVDVADVGLPDSAPPVPTYHRPNDDQCATPRPAGSCAASAGAPFMCLSDSQCTDGGLDGRCTNSGG